jgi:zinc ribbon protein
MPHCPKCGTENEAGKKFCRQCGMPIAQVNSEEANTWRLPPNTAANIESPLPTSPIGQGATGSPPQPTGPAYIPPVGYYPAPQQPFYPPAVQTGAPNISLGDWLSQGWRVYKENMGLMSFASFLAGLLSIVTLGVLAGPLLMGMYRMAFKTMRHERPEMNDLFNWEGRFLQAFLAFLISAAIYGGLSGTGNNPFLVILKLIIGPLLTVILAFTVPLILERKMDIAAAINHVGRLIFSKDALMWWVVGLVFGTLASLGFIGCFFGVFITVPWVICSSAVAYRDVFGVDDPNRTLH